jgi:hypothetical protein
MKIYRLLPLLLLPALPVAVQAQFTYTTNSDGSLNLSSFAGTNGIVVVPDTTNGLPVTSIGVTAFWNHPYLTNVVVGTNVTSIGNQAFFSCFNLITVTIQNPNIITNIGSGAFYKCYSLSSFVLPNDLGTIASALFENCSNLTSILIPDSVTNIGSQAFYNCGITNVVLGTNIANIANSTFQYCYNLASVTIANGVTNIGQYAFSGCAFTNISIPNSVTTIGNFAFGLCPNLASITIPNNVRNIGAGLFLSCSNLITTTLSSALTAIDGGMFQQCTRLGSVYFLGNAPVAGGSATAYAHATAYYLPGTTGWGTLLGTWPTVLWNPQAQLGDGFFGVQNNQFGFTIAGSSNLVIVVRACTDLSNPVWPPVSTNTLNTYVGTNGTSYFSDPQWTNHPNRFYGFSWQ